MIVKRGLGDHNNLHEENNTFEQVQESKYLGSTLNNQNNMHGEINFRLGASNQCLYALKTLFKFKLLSKKAKEHLYISYIRSIFTMHVPHGQQREVMMKNYDYLKEKFLEKCLDLYSIIQNKNGK